ncbi:solute carrier family 25 member 38 [Magnaporthiopsis poae ATCC 64411]|uniref:Solute carrier family 25 member 38 n=1 Tax=Magnaporthiopsis poae (strain ATCC 64411 / 73-15) TaxID=644358 RepID=A0A0C4E297_MAGP6|nr:solute carrier family 25 member 38 [Magnaporthiopsis poae ATCC 64411]
MSNGSSKGSSKSSFHFVAGLGSGILSAALLQPIDPLKTRVQQSGHHSLVRSLAEIRASSRGLAGLWRGTVPDLAQDIQTPTHGLALRMTRKALSSALAWTVYEELIMRAELSWSMGGAASSRTEKTL